MDLVIASGSVDLAHADAAPVSGTPQYFTNGNPSGGVPATRVPAYWLNGVQSEIVNVIVDAGLTPDKSDNTLLLQAIQSKRGSLAGCVSVTASGNLSRAHANKLSCIEFLAGNINLTLPARSGFAPGETLYFWNIGNYKATITRAGGDSINAVGTSIDVAPGDTLMLVASYASNVWLVGGGSASLFYSNGAFKNSLGSTGYRYLPSGEIEMWGTSGAVNAGASVAVTFPFSFPVENYAPLLTAIGSGTNANALGLGVAKTLSGLTIYNWGSAINLTGVHWRIKGK